MTTPDSHSLSDRFWPPPPISPPWNRPYAQWNRMQLDAGLVACAEYGWTNLKRQIRGEIAKRGG